MDSSCGSTTAMARAATARAMYTSMSSSNSRRGAANVIFAKSGLCACVSAGAGGGGGVKRSLGSERAFWGGCMKHDRLTQVVRSVMKSVAVEGLT